MRPWDDVDVHADVLVVVRRDWLLRHTAGGKRRERRDRYRNLIAEFGLRRDALRRSKLRIRDDARVCVAFQEPVVETWQVREQNVLRGEVLERLQRERVVRVGRDGDRAVQAGGPRRRDLQAV